MKYANSFYKCPVQCTLKLIATCKHIEQWNDASKIKQAFVPRQIKNAKHARFPVN